ncbi:hypothetical protein [Pelagibaculum spongiae]|uniref:Zinc resistance-associated protein n=1 Tax=Pelagibaculum spongiae TaxID=2080658 RepID=A0A2V1GQS1_9GAMM|nr:hypothetical protein [Pelagibaculum spongiae]PVZ66331.1 hypothetical protein DC094_16675 [Pelagibaculum spongiae]
MRKAMMAVIASAMIGVAAMSGTAMAQGFGGGHHNGTPDFEKMASWMNVAPENRAAFIEVMQSQHDKRVVLRRSNRDEMQQLRSETASKLQGLITAEQLEQFKSIKPGQGKRGHSGRHSGGHGMKAGYKGCQQNSI